MLWPFFKNNPKEFKKWSKQIKKIAQSGHTAYMFQGLGYQNLGSLLWQNVSGTNFQSALIQKIQAGK